MESPPKDIIQGDIIQDENIQEELINNADGTNIVTDPEQGLFYKDPEKWFTGLRYYLYNNIITLCLSDTDPNYEKMRENLVNGEAMKIWIKVFTHKSYNPNGTENYETIEHMGDTSMKTAFDSAVIQKYPGISEYDITLMNNYYVSKPIQRDISMQLELYKWLRIVIPVSIHEHEDLLEALFGGLFKIGDRVIGKGNGYSLTSNLAATIYKVEDIDITVVLAHPRSQIKEIIEKMRWHDGPGLKTEDIEKIIKQNDNSSKKWKYIIRLPEKAINYIKSAGANVPEGGIIAVAEGSSKKVTSDTAYKAAVEFLYKNYGITREWAFDMANKMMISQLDNSLRERLNIDGFNTMDYQYFRASGIQYQQLLGIKKVDDFNDMKTILVTVSTSDPSISSKNLKSFANDIYKIYGKQKPENIVVYNLSYIQNV